MASEVKTNKVSPSTGTDVTLGDSSDTFTVPSGSAIAVASGGDINVASGGEIDIASGATLDVNGTIDLTGATKTGFPGLFSSYAIIVDAKASGNDGGTFTYGAWRTRDLNTEVADPDGIVSISANQFTFSAGNYLIQWSAMGFQVSNHQTVLYDITGTAIAQDGSCADVNNTVDTQTTSIGSARVTPSGSNVYEIQHRCNTTASSNGFGNANSFGNDEVFTSVIIYKES